MVRKTRHFQQPSRETTAGSYLQHGQAPRLTVCTRVCNCVNRNLPRQKEQGKRDAVAVREANAMCARGGALLRFKPENLSIFHRQGPGSSANFNKVTKANGGWLPSSAIKHEGKAKKYILNRLNGHSKRRPPKVTYCPIIA